MFHICIALPAMPECWLCTLTRPVKSSCPSNPMQTGWPSSAASRHAEMHLVVCPTHTPCELVCFCAAA